MSEANLAAQIAALVDTLRSRRSEGIGLVEVAAVTEILISAMRTYFSQVDSSLYREFRDLADYIARARNEIAQLRPDELKTERLPRAGRELEAIVRATEEATHTIMGAAEEIMGADATDPAAYKETVDSAVMRIFEACSFQDITGQRITKVVDTLAHVEERLTAIRDVWGGEDAAPAAGPATAPREDGRHLLNGPQLDGEGVSQSEIDDLFN